jgi:hypothetical protein
MRGTGHFILATKRETSSGYAPFFPAPQSTKTADGCLEVDRLGKMRGLDAV